MIEIDSITRALDSPASEDGDYTSDEYLKAIELATAPHVSNEDQERLASAARRLNRNRGAIRVYLGYYGLLDTYNDVAQQVNQITEGMDDVPAITPVNIDDTDYFSPCFIRAGDQRIATLEAATLQ